MTATDAGNNMTPKTSDNTLERRMGAFKDFDPENFGHPIHNHDLYANQAIAEMERLDKIRLERELTIDELQNYQSWQACINNAVFASNEI
jgi:hypothetical protein